MLPHLRRRPVTLTRYPNGVEAKHFFEKRCPDHRPDWVATARVFAGKRAGEIDFCLCEERATLVWLAQLAALELHPSLSLAANIRRPTVLAFDLDPGEPATVVECCAVALRIRSLFDDLGLQSFPKTSGGKGLQVYVPLNTATSYEDTKPYAQAVAQALERNDPDAVVSRMTKKLRRGKVFVDWSQNDQHKTTVAVYSLRARERPTVSTPIAWEEVETAQASGDPDSLVFDAADVVARVERNGDLFAQVLELKQKLPNLD